MTDSTNLRIMANNIRQLSGEAGSLQITVGTHTTTLSKLTTISSEVFDTGMKWVDGSIIYGAVLTGTAPAEGNATNELAFTDILWWEGRLYHSSNKWYDFNRNVYAQFTIGESFTGLVITPPSATYQNMEYRVIVYFLNNPAPTPDVLPSPDPDTRALEKPETEPESEPIEEKK